MSTVITSVDAGSPAERAGIRAGEQLLMINHHEIVDVLDYRFFCYDPSVSLRLREADGTTRHLTIEKEEGEDLGLNFDTYLMDEPRPCSNHCLFCFVDQMPPNMRDTLYFKDDDARLSFLMGNYITLTNLTEREAQRIIDLRISPINVSVQATEPQLRRTLLGNKDADKSLEYMRAFGEAGIEMNGQIVVCPGWNDGEHLRRSIEDLMDIGFNSCSIVPVGLTKFRKGLARLEPVTKEKAGEIIDLVDEYGAKCLEKYGTRMFFCADEFYIKAERPLPDEEYYEEYQQLHERISQRTGGRGERRCGELHRCDRKGRRAVHRAARGGGEKEISAASRRGRRHRERLLRPHHHRLRPCDRAGPHRAAQGPAHARRAGADPREYAPPQ